MKHVLLAVTVIISVSEASAFTGMRLMKRSSSSNLCETGNPPIGTVCPGGAIWAGIFSSGRYMIVPGGCAHEPSGTTSTYPTADFTPTCSGTDTTSKIFKTGTAVDVPGVENIGAVATPSSVKGNINTTAMSSIYLDAEGGYYPAARYCDKLDYGGYNDWYLPSKSEMAYVMCKARTTIGGTLPQEDQGCASYGLGSGSAILTGFGTTDYYWTSTEYSAGAVFTYVFSNGNTRNNDGKSLVQFVRCVRRMGLIGGLPSPIGFVGNLTVTGLDVDYLQTPESTPKSINIKNLSGNATGVAKSVSAGFTITGGTCSATASSLAAGSTCTIEVKGASTGRLSNGLHSGSLTVTSDDGNAKAIYLTGTSVNLPDPCLGSPPLGTVCNGGALFAGTFGGSTLLTTPGGCGYEPSGTVTSAPSSDFTPTCGGTDTTTKSWNSGAGPNTDIAGVQTVAAAGTASTVQGDTNTAAMVAAGTHAAASYCDKLNFGGYTDWYLPSKSELTYLYCKSRYQGASASYPQDDLDCAASGYADDQHFIPGFVMGSGYYWSSTESGAANAWRMNYQGALTSYAKNTSSFFIRCVRKR